MVDLMVIHCILFSFAIVIKSFFLQFLKHHGVSLCLYTSSRIYVSCTHGEDNTAGCILYYEILEVYGTRPICNLAKTIYKKSSPAVNFWHSFGK